MPSSSLAISSVTSDSSSSLDGPFHVDPTEDSSGYDASCSMDPMGRQTFTNATRLLKRELRLALANFLFRCGPAGRAEELEVDFGEKEETVFASWTSLLKIVR